MTITPEERAALLDGLYEEDRSVDMLEYHAKVLGMVHAALTPPAPPVNEKAEAALEFLRGNVRRLCHVLYAGNYLLANKAERFYAELPAGDGDDFRDWMLEGVRCYAGQFPGGGKRAEVTAALQEVMDA